MGGYTIVEVMIVLAISGAMMVASVALISGKQQRTEFSTASRAVSQQLKTVINETTSGHFPNEGDYECRRNPGGGPTKLSQVTGMSKPDNSDCILVGNVFVFNFDTEVIRSYALLGQRVKGAGPDIAEGIADTKPVALAPATGNPNIPDKSKTIRLQQGLKYKGEYADCCGTANTNTFAVAIIPPINMGAGQGSNTGVRYYSLWSPWLERKLDDPIAEADWINSQNWIANEAFWRDENNKGNQFCFSDNGGRSVIIRMIDGGVEPSMEIKEGEKCGWL